jgi:predicted PurR-regulated permease PerM
MSELILHRLERPIDQNSESTLKTVLIGVVVVVALYLGREVLIPIALAVLLTFVLAPLVRLLQGLYFPRIIAVTIVGLFAFAAIFGLGALMVSQVNQLAADLPRCQSTLGDKIQSLRGRRNRYARAGVRGVA